MTTSKGFHSRGYYSVTKNDEVSAFEIKTSTGLDISAGDYGPNILNKLGIYEINRISSLFDSRLYNVVRSFTINGTYADETYTKTALPLADAKVAGVSALKERAGQKLELEAEGFPILSLIASASKLQADRDADAQAVLSDLQTVMADLQTDIDTVNAATAVDTIDAIVNSDVIYDVTVSGSVFYIDGVQQPALTLERGKTYSFDQSDASNSGHPLRIYDDANKTTEITADVEIYGTPGSAGAYTKFYVRNDETYSYQCSAHAAMGGDITVS